MFSRAANGIRVVQRTMSRSLARSGAFGDELFIQIPDEMQPTDGAEALAGAGT